MADNTVTLTLNGDVPLEDFAKAIASLDELVRALSEESGNERIDWVVQDLQVSSATATVAAAGNKTQIQKVIADYAEVGAALENGTVIPFAKRVATAARNIIAVNSARIPSVTFDTSVRTAIVRTNPQAAQVLEFPQKVPSIILHNPPAAYGAVEGRIQTLTSRGGLRFTLFDLLNDKAVNCYFAEGKQEIIRGLWGKLAVVEGCITRDPFNGRPISIRQVENIQLLPEPGGRFDYQLARGVAPSINGLSPEEAIRRTRDVQ
jgi:hypothetical protein